MEKDLKIIIASTLGGFSIGIMFYYLFLLPIRLKLVPAETEIILHIIAVISISLAFVIKGKK